jgi:hypothetical protein
VDKQLHWRKEYIPILLLFSAAMGGFGTNISWSSAGVGV